jgi:hypothetical protein
MQKAIIDDPVWVAQSGTEGDCTLDGRFPQRQLTA